MKRYCHPYKSWFAVHFSDGSIVASESVLATRKKELFYDRDIRNVTYWSGQKEKKSSKRKNKKLS